MGPPPPGWGAPGTAPGPGGPGTVAPGSVPGPPHAPAPRPSTGGLPAAGTIVGSALTMGIGLLVAVVLFVNGDGPGEYFGRSAFQSTVAALAMLAAPIALLVAWDEIDLSMIGTVALGTALYAEMGDDGAAGALAAASAAGVAIGAAVGAVRWLTGAHPALVSLAAGVLVTGIAFEVGDDDGFSGAPARPIDGQGLPMGLMVVVVLLATVLAVVLARDPADVRAAAPHPRVVLGFALTGLAGCLYGAVLAGIFAFAAPGQVSIEVFIVFTTVAVAGVVRASGLIAPLLAVPAAAIVTVLSDSVSFNGWSRGEHELVLGGVFLVTLVVGQGLARLLGSGSTPAGAPAPGPAPTPMPAALAWGAPPGPPPPR